MDLSFDEYIARSPKSRIWPGNKALLWAQEAKEGATDRRPVGDLASEVHSINRPDVY